MIGQLKLPADGICENIQYTNFTLHSELHYWSSEMTAAATAVLVLLAIFGFLGAVINTIVFYALFKVKIGSRLTSTLMQSQCVFNGFTCLVVFLYKVSGSRITTGHIWWDTFFCYLWNDDILMWFGVAGGLCNAMCISIGHAIAVFFPVFYKMYQIYLMWALLIYVIVIDILLYIPIPMARIYVNGICQYATSFSSITLEQFITVERYMWLALGIVSPVSVIVVAHTSVIVYIYRHWKLSDANKKAQMSTSEEQLWRMRKRMKEIALSTAAVAGTLLICNAFDITTYVLQSAGLYKYINLSLSQQAGVVPIIMSSCIVPCILVASIKSVRRYFLENVIFGLLVKFGLRQRGSCMSTRSQSEADWTANNVNPE
ncbi:unnamed protein product [Echinostoma caproni]|uniref:G_PROTEIN_RECEP_F1_2 domain-containing protein n=1 Tax=Echinostoma caproni TaxID=27848 RepID=A0A183AUJ2_9TREM|nr:unnamed protein product [Echinostoma caproni]